MIKTVGAALEGFGDLPDEDREMLFETFRVWQDSDASVRGAAEVLICHPNTVRHRLRRIEKHTGRFLSRPRSRRTVFGFRSPPPFDVAENPLTLFRLIRNRWPRSSSKHGVGAGNQRLRHRRCHKIVITTRGDFGELTGDGVRRFALVKPW
jgi:hypothetical protein